MSAVMFDARSVASVFLFAAVMLLVEGLYMASVWSGQRRAINRRLGLLAKGAGAQTVLGLLRRRKVGEESGAAGLKGLRQRLDRLMTQAGIVVKLRRLAVMMAAAGAGAAVLLMLFTALGPVWSLIVGAAGAGAAPWLYLWRARAKRLAHFGRQLPDALDLMARSLRAGHPVSAAMSMVAREMGDPLGSEFGIAVDEMTYGLDLCDAVRNIAARVPHPDCRYMVVAIAVQHGSGGNLAEALAGLARVIRNRFQLRRKVRSLSAEGRLSAYVLSALPVLVGGAIRLLNPQYFTAVQGDPLFNGAIALGAGLMTIGIVTMWRMIDIRV